MSALEKTMVDPLAFLDPWVRKRPEPPALRLQELPVPVMCLECLRIFSAKPRMARDINSGKRKQLCTFCLGGPTRIFRVEGEHGFFWLERFSRAEIVELAELCWGPVGSWGDEWRSEFVWDEYWQTGQFNP